MSTQPSNHRHEECLELPVEEQLRRAVVLPPYPEMVIEDLSDEEGQAFLDALKS